MTELLDDGRRDRLGFKAMQISTALFLLALAAAPSVKQEPWSWTLEQRIAKRLDREVIS